jgi:hypothetical protein
VLPYGRGELRAVACLRTYATLGARPDPLPCTPERYTSADMFVYRGLRFIIRKTRPVQWPKLRTDKAVGKESATHRSYSNFH